MSRFFNIRTIVALSLLLVLMAASFAFAASNTFVGSPGQAGDGAVTVSGYQISNMVITRNGTDPSLIDQVDFDTDAAATTVEIRLDSTGTDWYSCVDGGGGTSWTCDTTSPQATVAATDQLRVLAFDF
jgi:hypothetical protein